MSARFFLDSNVLLYVFEERSGQKFEQASVWLRHLEERQIGVTNLQVLNEVANVLLKRKVPPEAVFAVVDRLTIFGAQPVSLETVFAARLLRLETGYSWWDCILLASAMELGCRSFLSEDLRDGHAIRGLTVINPFRHSPSQYAFH